MLVESTRKEKLLFLKLQKKIVVLLSEIILNYWFE